MPCGRGDIVRIIQMLRILGTGVASVAICSRKYAFAYENLKVFRLEKKNQLET